MKKFFEEPIVEIEKFMMESVMNESTTPDYDEDWTPIG